ncbi:MAG: hypothetical protein PEPC_01656 [Peptostreptococcus russellii]
MKKESKLVLKGKIKLFPENGKELFSSRTLEEMEMASLVGGDEIVPYGGFNALACFEFNACVSFNVVCVNCGCGGGGDNGGPGRPTPGPGAPGNGAANCLMCNGPSL